MADEEKKEEATEETPAEEAAKEVKEEKADEKAESASAKATADKEPKEEAKEEPVAAKADAEAEKAAPTGKFKDLIKEIETMSVSDLSELVKALEDRFGVSAAMPMAVAGASAAGGAAAEVEEKSSYTVVLKDGGAQKIAVIKAVREIDQNLGLVDAKNLVDSAPKEVKKHIPKDEAEEAKKKLEAAGATVELV